MLLDVLLDELLYSARIAQMRICTSYREAQVFDSVGFSRSCYRRGERSSQVYHCQQWSNCWLASQPHSSSMRFHPRWRRWGNTDYLSDQSSSLLKLLLLLQLLICLIGRRPSMGKEVGPRPQGQGYQLVTMLKLLKPFWVDSMISLLTRKLKMRLA